MHDEARDFCARSTLLFIASRNGDGHLDVSPRGGQPAVLRVMDDGRLLLPDVAGNRRLDTIGNLQADDRVALALLVRGAPRWLHLQARAHVSRAPDLLRAFPADEAPPLAVLVLAPLTAAFHDGAELGRAGFWGAAPALAPLDLRGMVAADKAAEARAGLTPVPKDPGEEAALDRAGLRAVYGTPSEGVRRKVSAIAGPGARSFLAETGLTVLARPDTDGPRIELLAQGAPEPVTRGNHQHIRLPGASLAGECALAAVAPGRNELLRLAGRAATPDTLAPREIYFHCAAAFSRARAWQDLGPAHRPRAWTGKRRFRCTGRVTEAPEVVSFLLAPDDDAPLNPALPGQYVTVALPGAPDQRSYSISGQEAGSLRITVRRLGRGGLSDALHDRLMPGDLLGVGAPAGRFVPASAPGRPIVLIAAGVGATPLLPMLHHFAGQGRETWFLLGVRDGDHHLFCRDVARHAGAAHVHLRHAYSRPRPGETPDHAGRIDAGWIAGLLPVETADVFICGPGEFMAGLTADLQALGVPPEAIRSEVFQPGDGPGAFDTTGLPDRCRVRFTRSGVTADWTPGAGTLLDLALAAGVQAPHSCRIGDCQSCAQTLLDGQAAQITPDAPPPVGRQVLLCQAVPLGDLDIDC